MSDKIAEIRARHEAGAPGEMPIVALAQADADRELLLAEIDRLRAQIVSLEATGSEAADEIDRLHKALYRIAGKVPFADDPWTIARKALEAKP